MTDEDPENESREQGIEFGDLKSKLDDADYPLTNEELVEQYGDETLELPNGERTLAETIDPLPDDQKYEEPFEVEQAVMNMVDSEAVGREGYSDRGAAVDTDYDEADEDESV
jgi:hypothetical protein